MRKIIWLSACLCIAGSAIAGFVDHGDCTGFPNVNVDAHIRKIAALYYPETTGCELPKGLPRAEAWRHDIAESAEGLDIPREKLDAFIASVLHSGQGTPVSAPHEKLLEFELYARGRKELVDGDDRTDFPPAWKALLDLPLEKRRYTTIPVLYAFDQYAAFRQISLTGQYLPRITAARMAGCPDTQGCERACIADTPSYVYLMSSPGDKIQAYRHWLQKYGLDHVPGKPWRYTNAMDTWSQAWGRGDTFFSGAEMPPLRWFLYLESEETLREMSRNDPALRDLIVALGLTNRQMISARKIAEEFAEFSPVNVPVLALRLPFKDAERLLKGKPEYAQLLDLLTIKELSGKAKVAAIDAYLAKYPDYTPDDMPKTSIALNTHAELQALAGLELLNLGEAPPALERWMKGGTPEDIGLVAEQVFSVEELIDFCRKHAAGGSSGEKDVDSYQCASNNKILYPNLLTPEEATAVLRNILARRLMREKRFAEAREWFTGDETRCYSEQFFRLKTAAEKPDIPKLERLEATLTLAALIRFQGDRLFGTFLEPDNVICRGSYRCEWGTQFTALKLNKPTLPRYHYRWIAAEYYRSAADLTDDPKQKGFCFWMAGTLLKNRDPELAERDCRQGARFAPELTSHNWFNTLSKVPAPVRQWYHRKRFIFGPDRIAAWKPELPPLEKVELPENDGTAEALLKMGIRICENEQSPSAQEIRQAVYALRLAGEMGNSDAYAWCGTIMMDGYSRYEDAVAFLQKALALNPDSNLAKHELGRAYLKLGFEPEGAALIRTVADTETENRDLLGFAALNMAIFYAKGLHGLDCDEKKSQYYLEKSIAAGCRQAKEYLDGKSE